MINTSVYAELLYNGISLEINRLCVSPYKRLGRWFYQVHCDDFREQFSRMYKDPFDAAEQFVKLKNKLYGKQKVQQS